MAKLVILGTANAVADEHHENTHMVLAFENRLVLIDCVNNPILRLRRAGLDFQLVSDLVLTHFHPDHVSGVPTLLMNSWLLGRRELMRVHGSAYTLERVEKVMDLYDWRTWPNFFPVQFHNLPDEEMTPVMQDEAVHMFASPVKHLVPAIGLRLELQQTGRVLAYSGDTEPCPQVARLAQGADVLIHEATGASRGHSSAAQAGEIALQAGAGKLMLIHYETGDFDARELVDQACHTFGGPVELAKDFMEVEL